MFPIAQNRTACYYSIVNLAILREIQVVCKKGNFLHSKGEQNPGFFPANETQNTPP